MHSGRNGHATRQQPRPPAQGVSRERGRADPEDLVRRELAPQVGEILDGLLERAAMSRQVSHVDRTRRFASEDLGPGLWKVSREAAEHTNLIGGPGATAAERDRQVAARRRLDARFRTHAFTTMTAWNLRRVPLGLLGSTAAFWVGAFRLGPSSMHESAGRAGSACDAATLDARSRRGL